MQGLGSILKTPVFFFLRNWCFFVVNDDSDEVFGENGMGRRACLVVGGRLADLELSTPSLRELSSVIE